MRETGIFQTELAHKMDCSQQYDSKILKAYHWKPSLKSRIFYLKSQKKIAPNPGKRGVILDGSTSQKKSSRTHIQEGLSDTELP